MSAVLPRLADLGVAIVLILLLPVAAKCLEAIGRAWRKYRAVRRTRLERVLAEHFAAERERFVHAVFNPRCPRCLVVRTPAGSEWIPCPVHADPVSVALEKEVAS